MKLVDFESLYAIHRNVFRKPDQSDQYWDYVYKDEQRKAIDFLIELIIKYYGYDD